MEKQMKNGQIPTTFARSIASIADVVIFWTYTIFALIMASLLSLLLDIGGYDAGKVYSGFEVVAMREQQAIYARFIVITSVLLLVIIFFWVHGRFLKKRNQTFGNSFFKHKFLTSEGRLPQFGFKYILFRVILPPILGPAGLYLIEFVLSFSSGKLTLMDRLSGTHVVRQ